MLETRLLRTLSVATDAGPMQLSAASGLARVVQRLFVVADDDHALAEFDLGRDQPGTLRRLFAGDLPAAHAARKRAKPDLEALARLPAFPGFPHGALLALGSGSRPQRQRAALLMLDAQGAIVGDVRELDLAPLYAPLRQRFARLNIEGAFVNGEQFCLLQRGNVASPVNALFRFDWLAIETWLCGRGPAPDPTAINSYDLGALDGVPLCFTDGTALPDGGWVFCAVAEDTADSYADGPCRGSAVGVVSADGQLATLMPLALKCKTEGIAASVDDGLLRLLLVTDADDPATPALLLEAGLPLSSCCAQR